MREDIFSTPIYTFYIDEKLCDWTFEVLDANRKNNVGKYGKYEWKSNDIFHRHEQLNELTDIFLDKLSYVYDDYGVNTDNKSIAINNMWGQISTENNYHEAHIHANSYFSGILYLKTPNNSGKTVFVNKTLNDLMVKYEMREWKNHNSGKWSVTPEKGKLLIFPSWIPHSVLPNHSDDGYNGEERSTLAFTSILEGNHNEHTMKINLSCNSY